MCILFTGSSSQQDARPHPTTPDRAHSHAATVDVSELVATANKLFTAGLASSTRRAYRSGTERYLSFCASANRAPFPASEEVLILFVSQLHRDKLAPGTIKTYIAAIRYEQISRGLGSPKTYEIPRLEGGSRSSAQTHRTGGCQ